MLAPARLILVEEGIRSLPFRSHRHHSQVLLTIPPHLADTAVLPIHPLPRHSSFAAQTQQLRRYSRFADPAASHIQPLRGYSRFANTAATPIQPLSIYSRFAATAASPIQPLLRSWHYADCQLLRSSHFADPAALLPSQLRASSPPPSMPRWITACPRRRHIGLPRATAAAAPYTYDRRRRTV